MQPSHRDGARGGVRAVGQLLVATLPARQLGPQVGDLRAEAVLQAQVPRQLEDPGECCDLDRLVCHERRRAAATDVGAKLP